MVLSIFGDESADETKQRVFAVGALIGTEDEWNLAEKPWVERTDGEVFHAADCEYAGKFQLYADLTQILAKSYIAGISVALDLVSHRGVFPDSLKDVAYYKCLSDVMAELARLAVRFNAGEAKDDPVRLEFTFDHRKQRVTWAPYIRY